MRSVFVYLVGPPGVGKFTVASILADRLPAVLVDNHYWINPILRLIQQDGITPLPAETWLRVAEVRSAVLQTIGALSPLDWNFVFTHAFVNDPRDYDFANDVFRVAERRQSDVVIVRLTCTAEVLEKRVQMPERRAQLKEIDPVAARVNAASPLFDGGSRKTITLDTSNLDVKSTVELVLQEILKFL